MAKSKAQMVARKALPDLVGPGNATGVVFCGVSPEERRLWERRVAEQGQPSAPNRANRRDRARAKKRTR